MDLLIYFALPLATIIISAILQKLLRNPLCVAALVFAIFLVVTFAAFDETFLIATLAYTLIALLTAFIVSRLCEEKNNQNYNDNDDDDDDACHHGCCNNLNFTRDLNTNSNRCKRF